MKTPATLMIIASIASNCGSNDTIRGKAEYESLEDCYVALEKAYIPETGVAFCIPHNPEKG